MLDLQHSVGTRTLLVLILPTVFLPTRVMTDVIISCFFNARYEIGTLDKQPRP